MRGLQTLSHVPAPAFLNADGGDFHLVSGSAGIDAGVDLSVDVPVDIAGNARPQGGGFDCGCYELEAAATSSNEFDDVIDELPEPVDLSVTLIPISQDVEETAPDYAELVAAWKEKMGWDRIETLDFALSIDMGPRGAQTSKMTMEYPSKWLSVSTSQEGSRQQEQYQLSDGVFLEIGVLTAEGDRVPTEGAGGPAGSKRNMILPKLLTYEAFSFQEAADFDADPSEAMFQKADGSPLDNLKLVMLTSKEPEGTYKVFVDPQSGRPVGWLLEGADGDLRMECIRIEYKEIAEGITYPVGLTLHGVKTGKGGKPDRMEMRVKMSDFTVNEPLAPETLHFTR